MKNPANSQRIIKNQSLTPPRKVRAKLLTDNRGVAIIEMAIILPILLAIVFATIEFGNYFISWAIAQRAVSSITSYVQTASPNSTAPDAVAIDNQLTNVVAGSQFGLVNLLGNVCVQPSFVQPAVGSSVCNGFRAGRADIGASVNQTYWVRVRVSVPYKPLTAIMSLTGITFPTAIVAQSDVQVGTAPPSAPAGANCTSSQYLSYNATTNALTCLSFPPYAPIPPDCTAHDQALHFYGGAFYCETLTTTPDLANCSNSSVNGLKWNGSGYDCVALPTFNTSDCSANTVSAGGSGSLQVVQYNAVSNSYTCSSLNQANLQGPQGPQGPAGTPGTPSDTSGLTVHSYTAANGTTLMGQHFFCALTNVDVNLFANGGRNACILTQVPTYTGSEVNEWKLNSAISANNDLGNCAAACFDDASTYVSNSGLCHGGAYTYCTTANNIYTSSHSNRNPNTTVTGVKNSGFSCESGCNKNTITQRITYGTGNNQISCVKTSCGD